MLFNDVRPKTNSSVVLTTGGLSLMVGSLLLSLSALSIYRINQVPEITINTSSWNWMSEVRLRLDAGKEAMGPQLAEAEIPEPVLVAPPAAAHQIAKPKLKQRWLAKAKSIARRSKQPVQEPKAKAIVLAQREESKPATLSAQPESKSPSASELNTLQGLHQRLRGQFILAMTTQPVVDQVLIAQMGPEEVPATPAVMEVEKAAVEVTPGPLAYRPVHHKKRSHKKVAVLDVQAEPQTPAPGSEQTVTTQEIAESDIASNRTSQYHDQIRSIQSAPQNDYSVSNQTISKEKALGATESATESKPGKILVTSGSQTIWVTTSGMLPVTQRGAVLNQNHAKAPAQSSGNQILARADHQMDSQSTGPGVNTQTFQSMLRPDGDAPVRREYSPESLTNQFNAAFSDSISLTEAFDWVSPVSGGSKSSLSKEAGPQGAGWIVSKAADHWPTLARRTSAGIPLISNNTSKLLSALAGSTLEAEAGIVFGKVPSGWTVRLSGRSERPVFLNERNQTISASNLEGDRYFAFLNAAPGAHLMYLANRAGIEEGAIGIAVLGGVATFTDLSAIQKSTLIGKVLDGSDFQAHPMHGISVRVLGALSARAETSKGGQFKIENVLTVGDYPVYIETDASAGYTHRYQLAPSQLQNAMLFRLSDVAIQTWINQLEGAISPESGIVIAAVPGLTKGQPNKARLTPVVQSLAANPTLSPEVYTISSTGQMQVGQTLTTQNTRFLSVHVPEGPAIARVVDLEKPANQNLIWSEMIMASPAVVNIVGPF